MKTWKEFREELRRLKAERWAAILAAEPPGRPAGRRPRDPEKEALLLELDRARIARSERLTKARLRPVDGSQPSHDPPPNTDPPAPGS